MNRQFQLFSSNTLPLFQLLLLLFHGSALYAEEDLMTSIIGKVVFPKEIPQGINMKGLLLKDAVVVLEGKYNHPRMPYPGNWRGKTPEERRAWQNDFANSPAGVAYRKKVEAARAQRYRKSTFLAADGTFILENVKPSWYQLTVQITPPNVPANSEFSTARAYALRQFFVKTVEKPHQLGTSTLKVKNVIVAGVEAPDFIVNDYQGGTFKLSDYRGKYVLFDFWATWCGPCIGQMPKLESVSKKFGGERFQVLGLSIDEEVKNAVSYLGRKPSSYRQGYVGTKELYTPIRTAYGIESVPSIWLIDPEGRVVAKNLMDAGIQEAVIKALKGRK